MICCTHCGYEYQEESNVKWDENGYGYSTKLFVCPKCGKILVVEYIEDYGLDVNNDERMYRY